MKKVIGITGSIGSGKSYSMEMFKNICKIKNINATFLNVDDIRRNIIKKKNINRDELNKKIYNNKDAMKKYKEFINPKIRSYLTQKINNSDGYIFIEWALLVEDLLYDLVDSIIVIYCNEEEQIRRLKSGNLGEDEITKRIKQQLTNEQKIAKIKKLKIEYYIIDTSNNPKIEEYEKILRKEGLYE